MKLEQGRPLNEKHLDEEHFRQQFETKEFLLYRLSSVGRRVSAVCADVYLAEFGLAVPEWRVLAQVGRFGSISPSDVSERTSMDRVAVSRAISTCVRKGLITERVSPTDRRSKALSFTSKGRAFYKNFLPKACELSNEIQSGLTASEVATLKRLLGKLDEHLDRIQPSATSMGDAA
jgi:DNA-binding MarR family transcriptional regulator